MRPRALTFLLCWAVLLAPLAGPPAAPAAYPDRPITVVIPFGAGGSHDLHARGLTPILAEILGQPVIVKLLPGGAGMKATGFVAKAKPDGYTLLFTHNGIDMIVPQTRKVPFDTLKAFRTVAQINYSYNLLISRPDAPWKDFKGFVAYAKGNPGKVNFGHSGVWGSSHVSYQMLAQATGIRANLIPHTGGGPALRAVLAGRDDVTFAQVPQALPQARAGKIRVLAVMGDERTTEAPDFKGVPSMAELGHPGGVGFRMERIFMAPAGIPGDRLKVLVGAFEKLMKHKSFQVFMKTIQMPVQFMRGEDYDKTRPRKYAEFTDLIKKVATR